MDEIRIAIVGVGNCASSLVQGLGFYRTGTDPVGLMHQDLGGYRVTDIRVACAFDVDDRKIGQPVSKAIFSQPNNAHIFCAQPPDDGALVHAGPLGDGVAAHLENPDESQHVAIAEKSRHASPAQVVKVLRETGAQVLVNYLPVGAQKGTEIYAQACLDARIAMVNCIPVFIASDPVWEQRFTEAGLPLVGDDVKSQFGATIVHRLLMALAQQRGITIDSSYQLNVGGNNDFLNMLERSRLKNKKISKTEAVTSQIRGGMDDAHIHIGPSDYIRFLQDNKVCYVRMNARGFGGLPMELDLKLSVEDSPNSAGVVVDAIRCAALGLENGFGGALTEVSAALMKHPPRQMPDDLAAAAMENWITTMEKSRIVNPVK